MMREITETNLKRFGTPFYDHYIGLEWCMSTKQVLNKHLIMKGGKLCFKHK